MRKEEILARLNQIEEVRKRFNLQEVSTLLDEEGNDSQVQPLPLNKGISVIIPTYKGEGVISACLNSLLKQTIKQDLLQIIIIINGEKDGTEQIVVDYIKEHRMDQIVLLYSEVASAAVARNVGIQHADREYVVFVDDDDYISENFLLELYKHSMPDTVVISQIADVYPNGVIDFDNPINTQVKEATEQSGNNFQTLDKVATITACKLLPTKYLKNLEFDASLQSGEDIVFYAELYTRYDLDFKVVDTGKEVIYYRVIRDGSVSRKSMSYDFYVEQRLDVIERLNKFLATAGLPHTEIFIKQKIRAQAQFLNRFLLEYPGHHGTVMDDIRKRENEWIPYEVINRGFAEKLIISYCFPPYADTSGNVMAKRLRDMKGVVDVVYNRMDQVRDIDLSLNGLVDDLIENRISVDSYSSFSNWKAIEEFCKTGIERIGREKGYKEIYSRAMWPGSHFLAYFYKVENPAVKWTAEFSDPIILDIHGQTRTSAIGDKRFLKAANKRARKLHKLPKVKDNNLYFWCEYLPYLFADELIFTNRHQLTYMLDTFPVREVRGIIEKKAIISPHPTLPESYYHLAESDYEMDADKVNIAYFGAFYATRNLDDLFLGLDGVEEGLKQRVNLHIFTAKPDALIYDLKGTNLEELVKVSPYASYMEFLNLTTRFDCLVVNDAKTKGIKPINPYLPSKISDYLGSQTPVWGICEEGSILSEYSLEFKSMLGDLEQATAIFEQIIKHKYSKREQPVSVEEGLL
ncbi:MAG: glycosyltransferase family A protein [Bacillus sp. (in: firmicutes)]